MDEIVDSLEALQKSFAGDKANDYPIITKSKAKSGAKFKKNLVEFWSKWFLKLKEKQLLEDEEGPLEVVKNWIVTMTSSSFRPFRHTATVIALALSTAICAATGKTHAELLNVSVQLKKKGKGDNASRMLNQLKSKETDLKAVKTTLESHMNDFFDGYPC